MCRRLIMLTLLLAVVAGIVPVTKAAIITNVVRRNPDGDSGDTEPRIAPGPLIEDAQCYVDRTPTTTPPGGHQYNSIPAYLIGAEYVMTANDDKDNGTHELDVTLSEPVTLYLFLDNRLQASGTGSGTGQGVNPDLSGMPWVAAMGFTDTGDDIGIDEAGDGDIDRWSSVFSKKVLAGTYTLKGHPQGYGGNMYGVAAKGPRLKAYDPVPSNGAPGVTMPLLQWKAGETAIWHDVYVGTNPTLGPADFVRRVQITSHWHDPPGFVPGTTYYWRVDEVEIDGTTIHTGDVWSFKYATLTAYSPSPPDGAKYVSIDADLSWTPGISAITHDVYFGTNQTDVTNGTSGTSKGNQLGKTYEPGTLNKDTVYYWRIDEVEFDKTTKYEGAIWSFKTAPDIPITDPNLLCWWKFDEGAGTTAIDWSGHDHHGTLEGGPQWVDAYDGGGVYFDGVNDYIEVPNLIAQAGSIAFWFKPDWDGSDPEDYRIFDASTSSIYFYIAKGANHADMNPEDFGFYLEDATDADWQGVEIDPAGVISAGTWFHVVATWQFGGGSALLYIDGQQVATGTNLGALPTLYANPRFGLQTVANIPSRHGATGVIDDVRIYNKVLTPEQIKQAMRGDTTLAWNPKPTNKALTDIERAASLTWSPGEKAAQHDVYFGTDQTAVANATAASTGIYRGRQVTASYAPPEGLQWGGGPYYWRIDEYNTDGTLSAGRVWSFTVADYLIVDDFEDYTDDVGSRIFQTWRDGLGFSQPLPGYPGNGTGSGVGNSVPPYAEPTIIHGGVQSMPLGYDNTGLAGKARYSETVREWASPLDWTKYSLKALTLYFYGALANAAEQLYVALEDNAGHIKVVNYPDLEAVQAAGWQEWNIELTQFSGAGVNLKAIKRMYIGLGNRSSPKVGGTGTIFIDDIRVYPSRCVPSIDKPAADLSGDCVVDQADVDILANLWLDTGFQVTPADPGTTGLIAHYPFNGNTNDVVGGHNGTTVGTPVYATGKIGQAIQLNGVDQMVDVGAVGISGAAARTIAGWAKSNSTAMPDWTNIFGFTGTDDANLSGRSFDIELRGGQLQFCIHVYGWEDNILPLDLDWHHLAATYDGTTIRWYGDGRYINSYQRSGTNALNTEDTVHIGRRGDTGEAVNFFPGKIDDVKIWNRALTAAQIAWLAGRTSTFSIPADLRQDNVINFKDFAVLADSWLEQVLWP